MIVSDISKSMAWNGSPETNLTKLAYAQRLIAALALVLLRQRDATGLITFDDEVRSVTPAPSESLAHHTAGVEFTHAGSGDGRGARAAASNGPAAPPRSRHLHFRPVARAGNRAPCAAVPSPSGASGHGFPFDGSRRGEPGWSRRSPVRNPETRATITLRPKDWADVYRETVAGVVGEWYRECRRRGIGYHRITTDTPFGIALRRALVQPSGIA